MTDPQPVPVRMGPDDTDHDYATVRELDRALSQIVAPLVVDIEACLGCGRTTRMGALILPCECGSTS